MLKLFEDIDLKRVSRSVFFITYIQMLIGLARCVNDLPKRSRG